MKTILVVDDEQSVRTSLKMILEYEKYAELQHDIRVGEHRVAQHRLQVGAVNDPVGRAIAECDLASELHARDFTAGARAADRQQLRRNEMRLQLFGKAEFDQQPRNIGRKLQASAGLRQFRRMFADDDTKSLARQRERRRQSADAGACDDDGSR